MVTKFILIYCYGIIKNMKKFIGLLFLSAFLHADRFEFFTPDTYEQLVKKIESVNKSKPIKDKWMKEAEYQAMYKQYLRDISNQKIFYKMDLGQVKVPCSGYSRHSGRFCYDVETEKLVVEASYSWKDNYKIYFNERSEVNSYIGQTTIQKNIGTSSQVKNYETYYDVVVLENLKSSFLERKITKFTIPIDDIRNNEDIFSGYLVFSVSLVNDNHSLDYRITDWDNPTIDKPIERETFERQIIATHEGVIIKKLDEIIFDSTPNFSFKDGNSAFRLSEEFRHYYKVIPVYPRKAKRKGIEGYVDISFTINEKGRIEDVIVIEGMCNDNKNENFSKPSFIPCKTFNETSVNAAYKMGFVPSISNNGKPISTENVKHRFTYLIED